MVAEDYVSFETAKLLKEKGFDWECFQYWHEDDNKLMHSQSMHPIQNVSNPCFFGPAAPTIQMAMKWLREVHCIDIEVRTHYLNYLKLNDIRYYSGKILKGSEDVIHTIYSKDTYEEVCEAAMKYCLENLI